MTRHQDELDLSTPCGVHIVGVGGAGMSAIATVLARMGHRVSGSDLRGSAAFDRLTALGVTTTVGHDAANVPDDVDAVVISTAIPRSNVEVQAADARSIPVLRRADALRAIVAARTTVAVAGSHGKTTTSSMLALILRAAGRKPSFVIGGDLNEVGTNALWEDDGDRLVVEADESDGTFLELAPHDVIVTSVLPDHLDHYGDFDGLVEAFATFLGQAPGARVVCADDDVVAALAVRDTVRHSGGPLVTYGFADDADYRISGYAAGRRSAPSSCRCPAGTTRATRPAPPRSRSNSVSRFPTCSAPWAGSGALPADSSSVVSATVSPTSTTTRTSRATSTR
jgi:UDP-N-acetylmuramate--alanine ligase